jgi:hypothetical protein
VAVVNVTTWRIHPGRLQEFIANASEARRIHERLGGRVRVWQPIVGGEPSTIGYAIEHDDMNAYGAFSDKLVSDSEWQAFLARIMGNADPGAEMVNSGLYNELPQL